MGWTKGKKRGVKNGGRVKGKNVTADMRRMVEGALAAVGGQQYLERQAEENPKAFIPLLAKLIPTQVQAEVEHTGGVQIEVVTGFSSGPHSR